MPVKFQYDVFLSHNAKDKAWVWRLAERLRATGGRAQALWFDEWVIKPGGSPRPSDGRGVRGEGLAIERGLEPCTACEGNLPFRDPTNKERGAIPLATKVCSPASTTNAHWVSRTRTEQSNV